MDTHNIHGIEVGFSSDAKVAKDFLRGEDKNEIEKHLSYAEKHGKSHFEVEGKKFTVEHNEDSNTYHVRPSNF